MTARPTSGDGVAVEVVDAATDELLAALGRLLPQLSARLAAPTREALADTLTQPGLSLLLARDADGRIVGMATLIVVRLLTGRHARLEAVVVDAAARGRGVGELLTRAAVRLAREQGASDLALTSNPRREAARRLYQRVGFTQYDTGVFVLALDE